MSALVVDKIRKSFGAQETLRGIDIALDSGETLSVAEFFNADDAEISYNRGERVAVTWVDGWEVVLPYEAD